MLKKKNCIYDHFKKHAVEKNITNSLFCKTIKGLKKNHFLTIFKSYIQKKIKQNLLHRLPGKFICNSMYYTAKMLYNIRVAL